MWLQILLFNTNYSIQYPLFICTRLIVSKYCTNYFDIVVGVLQRDTLTPFLFIICQDYIIRTLINLMKEMALRWIRQEADDTLHKLLRTQTT